MSDRRKPIMKLSYNFRVRTPTELFFPNITMYGYVHILTFSYIKTVKERTHIILPRIGLFTHNTQIKHMYSIYMISVKSEILDLHAIAMNAMQHRKR